MKVFAEVEQGSIEWHRMRAGRATASAFHRIITPKGKLSAQSEDYIDYLIGSGFMPEHEEFMGTKWTGRGTALEPQGRAAFEQMTGLRVETVGFVTRDDYVAGCSPDGLIRGPDGRYAAGLEIKSKSPHVHVGYIRKGVLPDDVKVQVHGCLAITKLPVWHLFCYFPGWQPLHIPVERDGFTQLVSAALDEFLIRYGKARVETIPRLQVKPTASVFNS
ncbi:MAG: Exonuclease [Verrucomicrobiales bacterium]|nr:Exonuclease [Verrucomicrobiales bacterium]